MLWMLFQQMGWVLATVTRTQFGFSYLEFDIALFALMRGGVVLSELEEMIRIL